MVPKGVNLISSVNFASWGKSTAGSILP